MRGWQPPGKVLNDFLIEFEIISSGSKSSIAMAADHGLSSVDLVIHLIANSKRCVRAECKEYEEESQKHLSLGPRDPAESPL